MVVLLNGNSMELIDNDAVDVRLDAPTAEGWYCGVNASART